MHNPRTTLAQMVDVLADLPLIRSPPASAASARSCGTIKTYASLEAGDEVFKLALVLRPERGEFLLTDDDDAWSKRE